MGIKGNKQRIPALLLALLLLLFTQQPAAVAHTKLLSATPGIASEIESWPTSITLEFDEELQNLGDEKANFVVVNNAVGGLNLPMPKGPMPTNVRMPRR